MKDEKLRVAVVTMGPIRPNSGKAGKVDIYQDPSMFLYLTTNRNLLYASKGSLKIGDKIQMHDQTSGRKKSQVDWNEVIDLCPCNKEDLLTMLDRNDYHYRKLKPFQPSPVRRRKLDITYSVKGVSLLSDWKKPKRRSRKMTESTLRKKIRALILGSLR